jgi:hypothetical protein
MQGLNNPIGIKSLEPNQNPFIMNPYRFAGANWDWEEDFNATASPTWTENDSSAINVQDGTGNNRIDHVSKRDGTNNNAYVDVFGATVSDTAWIWRFHLHETTFGNANAEIGICNESSGMIGYVDTTADWLGMSCTKTGTGVGSVYPAHANGAIRTLGTSIKSISDGDDVYMEIIRQSATSLDTDNHTDSTYGTDDGTQTTVISSGITGLRYIHCMDHGTSSAGGNHTVWWDDFFFNDGVTTPP